MNQQNPHPIFACFDGLLDIRDAVQRYGLLDIRDVVQRYVKDNPNELGGLFTRVCAINFTNSYAQRFQDLLVLFLMNGKRDGFFVEFGATNGRDLSNTFMLEQHFSWKGLLAEPANCWHTGLKANR